MKRVFLGCCYIYFRNRRMIIRRFAIAGLLTILLSVGLSAPLFAVGGVQGVSIQNSSSRMDQHIQNQKTPDQCLAILKRVKLNQPKSLTAEKKIILTNQNQYSKSVTLSYLMGVRYVVGPKELMKPNRTLLHEMSEKERYSLAIVAYRMCKKQFALQQDK